MAKYVAPALAAGLVPGGPPVGDDQWRAMVRQWFPKLAGTRLNQPTWPEIERHRERIKALVGVVPASVVHQRLVDEEGLAVSVASFRRYLRAHFPDEVRRGEVVVWRPPVEAGEEAQVDYGYLGTWADPVNGRRRRTWAFSMVLTYSRHLFVYPVAVMDQQAWVDEVIAGVSRFQVTVADFHAHRTSRRARYTAAAEVAFDVVVAMFASPKRPQDWVAPTAAGYQRVNVWDRDEGDRLATHLDRALGQLGPAIFLLSFMDTDLVAPTQALSVAVQAYADASTERARRTKSEELTNSLNDLGFVLGAIIAARWTYVLPRRRKPLPTVDSRPSKRRMLTKR